MGCCNVCFSVCVIAGLFRAASRCLTCSINCNLEATSIIAPRARLQPAIPFRIVPSLKSGSRSGFRSFIKFRSLSILRPHFLIGIRCFPII